MTDIRSMMDIGGGMIRLHGSRPLNMRLGIGLLIAVMLAAGCAAQQGMAIDGSANGDADRNAPLYYDFGDVLVPREMKVDKNASFVFRTPSLSAGVLAMKGRVESHSLIAFFETNMANDNWSLVSAFKSSRNIMLFKKENRWCVINITEKNLYTYLEIWVSPTVEGAARTIYQ